MDRTELAAVIAIVLGVVGLVVAPVWIVSAHSTHRLEACVESGGAYVNVPNTARMECERP
jgi:hypothetical protein